MEKGINRPGSIGLLDVVFPRRNPIHACVGIVCVCVCYLDLVTVGQKGFSTILWLIESNSMRLLYSPGVRG